MEEYVLGIDQSTQGTKVLLFNHLGEPVVSVEKAHKQIVDQQGWVEHDPVEIINNIYACVHEVINKAQIDPMAIRTVGIANQRETVVAWDAATGKPVYNAIVWQCSRAKFITNQLDNDGKAEKIFEKTGLRLSPFFSAAKFEWIIQQVIEAKRCLASGTLRIGTMDSWVLHSLTDGKTFQTDLSNASRTQLLNISTLSWDSEICAWFGIPMNCLPELVASDNHFGFTSFGGILPKEIPIRAILGDSHSSMFAMGCISKGMMKATYGTGSSIMMNIGDTPLLSMNGLVTSVAWKIGDKVNYVLEH